MATGYTGSRGIAGPTGPRGFGGSRGDPGPTGARGIPGFTGSRGSSGTQGSPGSRGAEGRPGFGGSKGFNGSTGFTGSRGYTGSAGVGYAGSQGVTGFTGSQGIPGIPGGYTGSQGVTGFTGSGGASSSLTNGNKVVALGADGTTTFPGMLEFPTKNIGGGYNIPGNALVLSSKKPNSSGSAGEPAVITTEPGSASSPDSQDILIRGGVPYSNTSGVAGDILLYGSEGYEGGDIELAGGRGEKGGSVIIKGGYGITDAAFSSLPNNDGVGGDVQISAGRGNLIAGSVSITAGAAAAAANVPSKAGNVSIQAGSSSNSTAGDCGNIILTAGLAAAIGRSGRVEINTSNSNIQGGKARKWNFDETGVLTVPGSIIPDTNIAYDLGSATKRFKSIYLDSNTIYLGNNSLGIDNSGQLSVSESYIVAPPNVPGISISAYWIADELIFLVAIANADKFDSLKVGDKITLLTGDMPANTVLTVTGPATSPKIVRENSYYVYTIPVNLSPSAGRPSVDSFSITRTTGGTGGTVSSLINDTKSVSLASTGVLTVPGSIIPDTNIAYDLGSATKRFRDIYLSTSTINLGGNALSVNNSGLLTVSETFDGGEGVGGIASVQWATGNMLYSRTSDTSEFIAKYESLKVGDQITLLTGINGAFPANTVLTVTGAVRKTPMQSYPAIDFAIPVDSSPAADVYVYRFTLTKITGAPNNFTVLPSGYVVFSTVTVPAHSYGVVGDVAGMVAFDGTYTYYCTANYVDNSTNIWRRTAHGTGTW